MTKPRRTLSRSALCLTLGLVLPGCALLWPDRALDSRSEFEETDLEGAELEARMQEAESLYAEPRTPERVARSLELFRASVSVDNGYEALWRAARSALWLAVHLENEARAIERALESVHLARAGTERHPTAAAFYYHGLALGTLSRLEGGGLRRVKAMEAAGLRAVELDERFQYAGGHRLLGLLYTHTKDHPLSGVGSFEEALEHLERAHELYPDYAYNPLALAELLLSEEEEPERARALLREAADSEPPPQQTEDHGEWVRRAHAHLAEGF